MFVALQAEDRHHQDHGGEHAQRLHSPEVGRVVAEKKPVKLDGLIAEALADYKAGKARQL